MRLWRCTAATLLVSIVILPVAAVARLWAIDFCLLHPRCRPDEDAISAIASGSRLDDLNPDVPVVPFLCLTAAFFINDLQDEFYLPLAGFHAIDRPGPNLEIVVRR